MSSNCRRARRWLSVHRDGELSARRAERLARHLADCQACRQAAAGLEALTSRLEALPAAEPRSGFTGRVLARLPEQTQPRLAAQPLMPATALASVALGLWLGLSLQGQPALDEPTLPTMVATAFDVLPAGTVSRSYAAMLGVAEE